MKKVLAALLLLAPAAAALAQQGAGELPGLKDLPPPPRYIAGYITGGGGVSLPFGGHWGDADAGFKPSPFYVLAASRRVDETLSYGLETSYAAGYGQRELRDMHVRLFSLTPFIKASFPEEDRLFYGVLGAGVYQWTQPAFSSAGTRYPSGSGSSGGINFGGGVTYPFWRGSRAGLDLRWHHIFNMKGANFSLGSVDNFCATLVIQWSVWKKSQ